MDAWIANCLFLVVTLVTFSADNITDMATLDNRNYAGSLIVPNKEKHKP